MYSILQGIYLNNELEDSKLKLEESERKRKLKDDELLELTEHVDDLKASNEYLSNSKMKLETDVNLISVRIVVFLLSKEIQILILGRSGGSKQCSQSC